MNDSNVGIYGLEAFRLDERSLFKLGDVQVEVCAHLDSYKITPAVIRRKPSERHAYLAERANRWVRKLKRDWPSANFLVDQDKPIITEIRSKLPAKRVKSLKKFSEIRDIQIERISGLRKKRQADPGLEWFCVRARVAIQIENRSKGMQTFENRFLIVKASSFQDAEDRLRGEWKSYASPYMNVDGNLVRWKLEEIEDVYAMAESEIDPRGTEIYSELKERRLKPKFVWKVP